MLYNKYVRNDNDEREKTYMDNRQHLLENALYAFNSGKTKSQWIEENKNTNLSHIKSGDFGIDMFWNIAITMNNICKHCKECNISSSFINNEHNRINALELSVQNIFMSAICIYKTDTTNSIYDKASIKVTRLF